MYRKYFKRRGDFIVAGAAAAFLLPLVLTISLLIRATSRGPAIYWSDRIGRYNRVFRMPKFRTMYVGAPIVASHLLASPERYITPIGRFLRKTSLDEVPQLWSVLTGRMSLVGPRPALPSQYDVISLRTAAGIDELLPGITGWAQVNGRDELTVEQKVSLDVRYLKVDTFGFDLKILLLTVFRVVTRKGVSH